MMGDTDSSDIRKSATIFFGGIDWGVLCLNLMNMDFLTNNFEDY